MILDEDRKKVVEMVELGIWQVYSHFRVPNIKTTEDTQPLMELMLERQEVDDLHHAPGCAANHYHRRRLVFDHCSCGAAKHAAEYGKRLIAKRLYS